MRVAGFILDDHYREAARYGDPLAKIILVCIVLTYMASYSGGGRRGRNSRHFAVASS